MRDTSNEIADALLKATPPGAVAISDLVLGLTVEKWLTVTMIIYTVLQIVLIVRDRLMRRKRRTDKE